MKAEYKLLLSIVVFSLTVLLAGCATVSIRVPFVEPAEIDLKDIENIAIGDIKGYGGECGEHADEYKGYRRQCDVSHYLLFYGKYVQ